MATKGRSRAKSSSKTIAQQVVGTAAVGMPSPVKGIIASRWGARVTLVVVGLALASGVLTLHWNGYIPHLELDRKRAEEVRHEVSEKAEEVAHDSGGHERGRLLPVRISR